MTSKDRRYLGIARNAAGNADWFEGMVADAVQNAAARRVAGANARKAPTGRKDKGHTEKVAKLKRESDELQKRREREQYRAYLADPETKKRDARREADTCRRIINEVGDVRPDVRARMEARIAELERDPSAVRKAQAPRRKSKSGPYQGAKYPSPRAERRAKDAEGYEKKLRAIEKRWRAAGRELPELSPAEMVGKGPDAIHRARVEKALGAEAATMFETGSTDVISE
jgi:hypothetical protein